MAKIAQLIEGNYNILDNIPVINQDLTASGFTPVANTYYRHTGATTDTFTQGVIYFYDTAYHKLGESGGGTTLNRYEVTLGELVGNAQGVSLLNKIITTAKGNYTVYDYNLLITYNVLGGKYAIEFKYYQPYSNSFKAISGTLFIDDGSLRNNYRISMTDSGFSHDTYTSVNNIRVVYYNDTEIT